MEAKRSMSDEEFFNMMKQNFMRAWWKKEKWEFSLLCRKESNECQRKICGRSQRKYSYYSKRAGKFHRLNI